MRYAFVSHLWTKDIDLCSGPKVSRQFQFTHGISICWRQFQFTHGNFSLLAAISFYSQQFQFTHGNFSLPSPPVNYSSRQWPPKVKKRKIKSWYLKSIFKVKSENQKSIVDLQARGLFTWDWDEFRPVWVCIGLHTFLFMHLHGAGLKMNSDRSDFISVTDPTWVIFVPVRDCTVILM